MSAPSAEVPPQSIEAEQSVLGAMMVYEPALARVVDEVGLRREDFYLDRHRAIFSAICELRAAGKPVDELIVAEALRDAGKLEDAGGRDYVGELAAKVPAAANARHYAEIVKGHAITASGRGAGEKLFRGELSAAEAIQHLRELEARSAAASDRLRVLDLAEMLTTDPPKVEQLVEGLAVQGAATLLPGAPGVGKSQLAKAAGSAIANGADHLAGLSTFDTYGHLMPGNADEVRELMDAYLERANTKARLDALDGHE